MALGDLLHQLAEAMTNRVRLPVTARIDRPCSLPPEVQVALYRIAQEALNNVVKHAEAHQVELVLRCIPGPQDHCSGHYAEMAELHVRDDGRGFDSAHVSPDRMGVKIMRERAESIGAIFEMDSQTGRGTHIAVTWSAARESD